MSISSLPSPNYRLRQERIRQNWHQLDLADRLGTTPVTISRWESGSQQPSPYFREKLCVLFGKSPEALGLVPERLLPPSASPVWNVPFPRNPFFTGREQLLTSLHLALTSQPVLAAHTRSYGLQGLGGSGKTQLAIEYAYRYRGEYDAVLWIEAENQSTLTSSFVALAELLALPEQNEGDQNKLVAAVLRWLHSHRGWLLIFDNVEDRSLLTSFLPATDRGAMLLTTRLQTLGTLAQRVDLPLMTIQEGCDFLLARTKHLRQRKQRQANNPQEMAAARQIVVQMGELPLALEQAGAYIEATQCSLADYVHLFQKASLRLLDEHAASSDHPLSVSRTFLLIFEQVVRRYPAAAELLTVCAFLAPEAIPEQFFLAGATLLGEDFEALAADRLAFEEALEVLLSYSLVQRDASTHTLSIHRLVQVVLKGQLSADNWRKRAAQVTRAMTRFFPANEDMQTDYWWNCEQLLAHALVCISHSEYEPAPDGLALALMNHVAIYLTKHARYVEAEPLFLRAARIGVEIFGPHHALVAEALNGLGCLYYEQGRNELAEASLQQARLICEQISEPDYLQLAYPLNNLGRLYCRLGKYAQARIWYQQALHIREQALGPEHLLMAHPLNNLGILCHLLGRYEQAEPLYRQALRIREQVLGPKHPQLAYPLTCLGELYRQQGREKRAAALLKRALCIWEQALGAEHPLLAYPLNSLGELYRQQGQEQRAEISYQQALRIREQAFGSEHLQLAYPLHNLGELYRQQGKDTLAEALLKRALHIWEQALGPDHAQLAYPLNGLANLYREQRRPAQAELFYRRALLLRQRHLGSLHPDVAETLHDLASLLQTLQRITEALPLYREALVLREQGLGLHHPQTVKTRAALFELVEYIATSESADWKPLDHQPESMLLCACGCNHPLDTSRSRGKPRRFFSAACKQRFYRHASRQRGDLPLNNPEP